MGAMIIQICFSIIALAITIALVIVVANELKKYLKK